MRWKPYKLFFFFLLQFGRIWRGRDSSLINFYVLFILPLIFVEYHDNDFQSLYAKSCITHQLPCPYKNSQPLCATSGQIKKLITPPVLVLYPIRFSKPYTRLPIALQSNICLRNINVTIITFFTEDCGPRLIGIPSGQITSLFSGCQMQTNASSFFELFQDSNAAT
jgi:hypothetical protein